MVDFLPGEATFLTFLNCRQFSSEKESAIKGENLLTFGEFTLKGMTLLHLSRPIFRRETKQTELPPLTFATPESVSIHIKFI